MTGAKSVTFKPGKNAPSDCSIGIHSIGFHCGSTSTVSTAQSTGLTTAESSSSATLSTASQCHGHLCPASFSHTTSLQTTSSSIELTGGTLSTEITTACRSGYCTMTTQGTSSIFSPGCYGSGCSSSTSLQHITPNDYTSMAYCYGSTCSVSSSSTISHSSTASTSASADNATSSIPLDCPTVLPRCLNTWMFMSGCKDNTDLDCFCTKKEYVENVMGCVSAWSETNGEMEGAASYLMGICADYVEDNPAIITACTASVTTSQAGSAASSIAHTSSKARDGTMAWTTIFISTILVVAATQSTGISAGFVIPGSSRTTDLMTTVSVPQVQFATATVTVTGLMTASTVASSIVSHTGPAPIHSTAYSSTIGSTAGAMTLNSAYASNSLGNASGTNFASGWAPKKTASSSPLVPATSNGGRVYASSAGLSIGNLAALALLYVQAL